VLGGRLIVEALELAACGGLSATPQPSEGVSYAHKIEKAEALIDWSLDAPTLARRVRAFNPFPGASAQLQGETIKVWSAQVLPGASSAPAGQIVALAPAHMDVAAIHSTVRLTELQRPGGKRMPVADFLRGKPVQVGMCFEAAEPAPGTTAQT
jgi:methionyl-tRNA formyltransferase